MNRKICIKIKDLQIDNQIVRKSDEIIIKRDNQKID